MQPEISVRERLLVSASSLFYERGIPNVGINEVTTRAKVARMTLYNNFPSKDALVLASLERLTSRRQELIDAALQERFETSRSIRQFFEVAETLTNQAGFRGCAFINACLQVPDPEGKVHALVRVHKQWILGRIESVLRIALGSDARTLAQQVLALWDGGIVESYIQGSSKPIRAAREAALCLLGASIK